MKQKEISSKGIGYLLLSLLLTIAVTASCGAGEGDGDDNGSGAIYACSYEKRVTDGCDGYGWGAWEAGCYQFNSEDYYITPDEVCANITRGGLHCQAGCCIDTQFRNASLRSGGC